MARGSHTRFPRTGGRGTRRKVTWAAGPNGSTGVISGNNVTIFGTGSQATAPDTTLVRTRGELIVQLLTASASAEGFRFAFGMCTVTENAAGIGATAVPDPLADIAWDGWFFHYTGTLFAMSTSPTTDASETTARVISVDSKAMRKVEETDVDIAVFSVLETGTATMQARFESRQLIKLS